mmetsp:Transcript_13060/g.21495  ORF Transcript_13060/g.21495 Transcript_13060/m.21495 type:complete len:339 (-) Transcript_13060:385-1401(-)
MAWCCRRLSFLASSFACASFCTRSRSISRWSPLLASRLLDLRTTGSNPSSPFSSTALRRTHLSRPTRPKSLDPPEGDSLSKPESPTSVSLLPPEESSDDGGWGEECVVVGSSSSFALPAPSSSPAVAAVAAGSSSSFSLPAPPSSPPPPAAAAVVCSAAATRSSRLTSLCAPLAKSGLASMIGRPSRKISVSSPSSKEAGKPAPPRSSSDVEEEGCCCPPPSSAEAVVLASAALWSCAEDRVEKLARASLRRSWSLRFFPNRFRPVRFPSFSFPGVTAATPGLLVEAPELLEPEGEIGPLLPAPVACFLNQSIPPTGPAIYQSSLSPLQTTPPLKSPC